jgi:pyridoxal phosphate enzyme (YggS family)
MTPATDVAAALRSVRERIEAACRRARRDPASVRLVAVTKTVPPERVREAVSAGQDLFGENRVQEALAKMPRVGPGARWHLIGHLQRNKARHAVGAFDLIHGVDGEALARELDRRAADARTRQAVLVELTLAGEPTKFGVSESGLWTLLEALAGLAHVECRGMMTIPPPAADPEASRRWFVRLRELRDEAIRRSGLALTELSMGMTDDFEVAVEEGATLVRVGRAIFGERPPEA